jgi:hypothetical protein
LLKTISAVLVLASAAAAAPLGAAGAAPTTARLTASGTSYSLDRALKDSRISESSGLARSTRSPGVLFTHNDSGDGPRVFAGGAHGRTRAVLTLKGASAVDWEDISSGPNHTLWVADIGDNSWNRRQVSVYAFTEPTTSTLASATVGATRYNFTYPDGPRNAEALMVNPVTGRLYIVSKSSTGGAIYAAPSTLSTRSTNTLAKVANAPSNVTAASFAPDARSFVLGTYTQAHIYSKMGGDATTVAAPSTRQGESMEIDRTSSSLLVGSEGLDSPVYRMPLPAAPTPTRTPTSTPTPTPTPSPTPTPTPTPAPLPAGSSLLKTYDLTRDEGWERVSGVNANRDSSYNRREQTTFGPDGMTITAERAYDGATIYSSDAKGKFGPVPNHFAMEADVTLAGPLSNGIGSGMFPAFWFRPMSGQGEMDVWEYIGGKIGTALEMKSTMIKTGSTTYMLGQKEKGIPKSAMGSGSFAGLHRWRYEKTAGAVTLYVDGVRILQITRAELDAAAGAGSWDSQFEAGQSWYPRFTFQVGPPADGHSYNMSGPIPSAWRRSTMTISRLVSYRLP